MIEHTLASLTKAQSDDQAAVDSKLKIDIKIEVDRVLQSEDFKRELNDRLQLELDKKNRALLTNTCHYLLFPTADGQQFIALDNFTGTEDDIDPLREHLQEMFVSFFKGVKLRIRPSQLLLGVVLRKEYDIMSMDSCIHIGRALSMGEEEVKFSLWYLDWWVGALIYHPEIEDEDE